MEKLTDAIETIVRQRVLEEKRATNRKNFYAYRERHPDKCREMHTLFMRKWRAKKKEEKLALAAAAASEALGEK
jgi:hypothetical protein